MEEAARAGAVGPVEALLVLLRHLPLGVARGEAGPARLARGGVELGGGQQRAVVVDQVLGMVVEEFRVALPQQLEAADRRREVVVALDLAVAMRARRAGQRRDRHPAA